MFDFHDEKDVIRGIKYSVVYGCLIMVVSVFTFIYIWNHPPVSTLRNDVKLGFNSLNGFLNDYRIITSVKISGETERIISCIMEGRYYEILEPVKEVGGCAYGCGYGEA